MTDSRFLVRDGLRRLLDAEPDAWPGATPLVFRGRLLDETGSDARPLVVLLQRVGEWGIVERLREASGDPEGWRRVRAACVVTLTDEHFLRPEMAQWAVEAWGYGLGLVDEAALTPGIGREAPPPPPPPPAATIQFATAATAATPAGRAAPRPAPTPAAMSGLGVPRTRQATPYRPPNAPVGYRPPRVLTTPRPARSTGTGPPPGVFKATLWASGAVTALAIIGFAVLIARGPRDAAPVAAGPRPLPPAAAATANVAPAAAGAATPAALAAAPDSTVGTSATGMTLPIAGTTAARATAPAPDSAPELRRRLAATPAGAAALSYSSQYGNYAPLYAAGTGRSGPVPLRTAPPGGGASGGSRPMPEPSRLGVPSLPPALPGATGGALPASAADSARLYVVRPPVRATLPLESRPVPRDSLGERPGLGLRNVGTGRLDEVRMRDGRVLRGRVEVVRQSELQFLDAESRLRYVLAKRDVREVITEYGTRVTFSSEPAVARADPPSVSAVVRRGVGGRYRVVYTVSGVTGSPECRQLWAEPPSPDVFDVRHRPGADTLSVRVEGGGLFPAVIDEAGAFATSLLPQPEASVGSSAITSRMAGRFIAGGLAAEVTIIGYRRQPGSRDITCTSVLQATGNRLR